MMNDDLIFESPGILTIGNRDVKVNIESDATYSEEIEKIQGSLESLKEHFF